MIKHTPTRKLAHTETMFLMVRDFQHTFECQRFTGLGKADFAYLDLRARLLKEERDEYENAREKMDILDALCDELYFALGTQDGLNIQPGKYTSEQAARDNVWIKPSFVDVLDVVIQELECGFPCPRRLPSYLDALNARILDIGAMYGFDMLGAFTAVHENNMGKLWNTMPIDLDKTVKVLHKGHKWLVMREDGKILKPPGFEKVDLTPFLKR